MTVDDDGNKDKTNKQKWQPFTTNLIDDFNQWRKSEQMNRWRFRH